MKHRTAIMVVLNPSGQALIQHRTSTAPWMPLYWDLPGGWANDGESDEAAAIREVQEECGLTPINIRELGMVTENVRAFLGYVSADAVPQALPNPDGILEHDEFQWVTLDVLDEHQLVMPAKFALQLAWETSTIDFLSEYPPMIWNPLLGEKVLVRWWTQDDQHHVIISDDEAGALSSWLAILGKHGTDAKLKQFLHATLVPCPIGVASTWALNRYHNEVINFQSWILSVAAETLESTGSAPLGFEACKHKTDAARWSCDKCDGQNVIARIDLKKLFDHKAVRELYRHPSAQHPLNLVAKAKSRPQPVQAVVSHDPLPFPNQHLRVAILDGGHHQDGVSFKICSEWDWHWRDQPVLFFFQGVEQPIPSAFSEPLETQRKTEEAERKKNNKNFKRQQRSRLLESVELMKQLQTYILP